jgi:hypothetical protein
MTIPVICDRCRVVGTAGTGDFSHFGDLLDFDPVPRKQRVNGWDADAQRAFIALLATTGSKRRAALAIGRNAFGVDQLLKDPRGDSFRAAFERAMAIAKQNGAMKLATGVADAAARNAQMTPPSRLSGHEPEPEPEGMDEDEKIDFLNNIFRKFMTKVEEERKARMAGEVVAADFYLRQVTFCEIAFDLLAEGMNMDPWLTIAQFRRAGHNVFEIAETEMSRLLDAHRRDLWREIGDPDRPEHPPQRYLIDKGPISIEPQEYGMGGEEGRRLKAEYARRHMEDAEEQLRWEREQRRG